MFVYILLYNIIYENLIYIYICIKFSKDGIELLNYYLGQGNMIKVLISGQLALYLVN